MKGQYLNLETAEILARRPGEHTTLETRTQAYNEVDKQRRYKEILECLGNRQMTAKEIATQMWMSGYIPTNERNFVSPRATELCKQGILEVVGKKKCYYTGKTVSVYEVRHESKGV